MLALLLAACSTSIELDPEELLNPPRAATQTVQAETLTRLAATPLPTQASGVVPTVTRVSAELLRPDTPANQKLTVWVNETSDEHVAAMKVIADQFESAHGYQIEFVFVDSRNILPLARSAQTAERLPDVIFHNIEQTAGLLNESLLDIEAADTVAKALGEDSFVEGALTAHGLDSIVALPVDAWQYLLVYRKDWFDEAGLQAPNSLDAVLTAAQTFDTITFDPPPEDEDADPGAEPTEPPPLRSGIVVPNEQDLLSTQRVFEWFASANGCDLVDSDGAITFDSPACLEILEYYRGLITEYGPPDFQTDITALKAFNDGRTAMAVVPPSALAYFASNAGQPLTENVGVVTTLQGFTETGRTASFANITYMGIVVEADEMALTFAQFMLEQAYDNWLAVEPARKAPLFAGTEAAWLDSWRLMPMVQYKLLDETYPDASSTLLTNTLIQDATGFERWGFGMGQGQLMSYLYEELTMGPVLSRMLNGYISSTQAQLDAVEDILEAAAASDDGTELEGEAGEG